MSKIGQEAAALMYDDMGTPSVFKEEAIDSRVAASWAMYDVDMSIKRLSTYTGPLAPFREDIERAVADLTKLAEKAGK